MNFDFVDIIMGLCVFPVMVFEATFLFWPGVLRLCR